jgi:hypothetical protein
MAKAPRVRLNIFMTVTGYKDRLPKGQQFVKDPADTTVVGRDTAIGTKRRAL